MDYKLIKLIGKGGMGEVYLAYDKQTKKSFALKKLRGDLRPNKKRLQQFLNEAKVTQKFSHPSIIPVLDIQGGINPYYTMPFIKGASLRDAMHSLSLKDLLKIFSKICDAISYIHLRGYIHSDLKLSNIMVTPEQNVVILDLGLVKKTNLTNTKKIEGTYSYIAPEVIYGKAHTVRSEIYSLGMILYQLLTRRNPFHHSSYEEYLKNIHKEVLVPPDKLVPNIPPLLSEIAMKTLQRDPDLRFQTVKELIDALYQVKLSPIKMTFSPPKSKLISPKQIKIPSFKGRPKPLFFNIEKDWKPIYKKLTKSIQIAFELKKPKIIVELIQNTLKLDPVPFPVVQNGLIALLELDAYDLLRKELNHLFKRNLDVQAFARLKVIEGVLKNRFELIEEYLPKSLEKENLQPLWHLLEKDLDKKKTMRVFLMKSRLSRHILTAEQLVQLEIYSLWGYLLKGDLVSAEALLVKYPQTLYIRKNNILNFLYRCILFLKTGKAIKLKKTHKDRSLWDLKRFQIRQNLIKNLSL